MKRFLPAVALLMTSVAVPVSAQVWDFTGNSLLTGTYAFREIIFVASPVNGGIQRGIVVYGNIVFNGAGRYTINGNVLDSNAGGSGPYTNIQGTYSLSPNGYGFLEHPFAPAGSLHGLFSNGIFIGSSTENGINDLMIAVPVGSATNATFSGNYTMDYILPSGAQTATYASIAQLSPNGNGNVGTVPIKTYLGASGSQPVNQNSNGVTYSFNAGVGTLRFPTTAQLAIQGDKEMYISADGNFIFGGSRTAFDFFVGVRRATGTPPRLDGLYYSAGINHIPGSLDTFYGAFNSRDTVLLEHQRFLSTAIGFPRHYTGVSVLPSTAVTDYTDTLSAVDYTIGQDAGIRIGVGQTPYLGLRVAVRGPAFTPPGSGPYIFPTGIFNAASYAAFTAGVAPGELISIYGTNLAASFQDTPGGIPFPKEIGGVKVFMNGRQAALYFVSPGQIAVLVPWGTSESVVQIEVERDGVRSNPVTVFRALTSPGIYSQSQSGEGFGAVLHADYSVVTEANPARPGEIVQVFLTGIGPVFPTIPDGGLAGNSNQTTPGTVNAFIDNLPAEVLYAGLAPTLAALYQVNVKVPDDASLGNVFLDISTPDAYTSQASLPLGPAVAADAPRSAVERPFVRRR